MAASLGGAGIAVVAGLLLALAAGSAEWLYSARPAGSGPVAVSYGVALGGASLSTLAALLVDMAGACLAIRGAARYASLPGVRRKGRRHLA